MEELLLSLIALGLYLILAVACGYFGYRIAKLRGANPEWAVPLCVVYGLFGVLLLYLAGIDPARVERIPGQDN